MEFVAKVHAALVVVVAVPLARVGLVLVALEVLRIQVLHAVKPEMHRVSLTDLPVRLF